MSKKLMRLGMQFFAEPDDGATLDDPKPNDATVNNPKPNDATDVSKGLTEEQKNDLLNKSKQAVFKDLGITPGDTKVLDAIKDFVEKQKLESQAEEDKSNPDVSKEIEEANKRALMAEAKLEAISLGVNAQYVDDVIVLAMAKITDDKDLKAIIGEFKVKYPNFFNDEVNVGKNDTGSNLNVILKNGQKQTLGQRLAAKKVNNRKAKSFWQ